MEVFRNRFGRRFLVHRGMLRVMQRFVNPSRVYSFCIRSGHRILTLTLSCDITWWRGKFGHRLSGDSPINAVKFLLLLQNWCITGVKSTMEPPREFPFPFVPYDIQTDFMKNLYAAIEGRKIGIFESPTGTGKSMSIICGALTWLRDFDKQTRGILQERLSSGKCGVFSGVPTDQGIVPFEAKNFALKTKKTVDDFLFQESNEKAQTSTKNVTEDPDWITEFIERQNVENEKKEAKSLTEKIKSRDLKMKRILDGEVASEPSKKRTKFSYFKNSGKKDETWMLLEQAKKELENRDKNLGGEETDECDPDIILEDYHSDEEPDPKTHDQEEQKDEESTVQKVLASSTAKSSLLIHKNRNPFHVTVVPLASRQSLCINESVRRLSSVQQINDKCLDMQKNSTKDKNSEDKENERKRKKSSSSCPFKTAHDVENLSEKILGKIQDIEEIVKAGKEGTACPYYAARESVKEAQLIIIPYQILLHSSTRKASGIRLKDSVIIVDEAHNLVDTISNIHSIEVTCAQVHRAHNQLTQYAQKFSKRLKAENLMYVKRILFILKKLLMIMGVSMDISEGDPELVERNSGASQSRSNDAKTTLMTIHNFLFKANLDNINLFKVLRYCERSMISRKLNGFVEKYETSGTVKKQETSSLSKFISNAKKLQESSVVPDEQSRLPVMRSPLMHIESFLSCLTSANEDGRIAVTTMPPCGGKTPNQAKIREIASAKFLLLNPAAYFKDIIDECRSLIVAGGTMQPSSSFVNQLLAPLGVSKDRIFDFSCGHVIGKDQLLPIVLSHGPSGTEFEFTFQKRKSDKLIDELGRTLSNLCNIIPGGIVCFFPSYDYEKMVHLRWQKTGILNQIGLKKKIFREPKKSSQVDSILNEYSTCIQRARSGENAITGSLLLSVVGGKMSEGINFSDDMGRCVVMVGLPYPNMFSAELKEKMAYLDAHMPKVGSKSAGQSYYESLCMKAVNQSIGRAIRHKNDHACIVLADRRYSRTDIKSQLPGWISDKLEEADRFATAFGALRKFFVSKKAAK